MNTSNKKKLFYTFASFDWLEKPSIEESKKPPIGLFHESCDKGVIWALPLKPNWKDMAVQIACTAVNYADLLIVFESDDYHKIDKLGWEKEIVLNENATISNAFTFINDSIEDVYAEYIVSYESVLPIGFINMHAVLAGTEENVLFPNGDTLFQNDMYRDEFYISRYALLEEMKILGLSDDISNSKIITRTDNVSFFTSDPEWTGGFLIAANATVLPLLLSGFANTYLEANIPIYSAWGHYSLKHCRQYFIRKNAATNFFENACVGGKEKYDEIRSDIRDFFDMPNINVYIARLDGYERNLPCPCGCGKKWKKCHGKNYM